MTLVTGELNQDFLLTAPQILFELDPKKAPKYNYCYVPAFSRYYFITSWNFITGLWMASCTVDVLASYKSSIEKQTLYVLRSASDFDTYAADTKYPVLADRSGRVVDAGSMFTSDLSSGCYVVGIVNKSTGTGSSRMGAVQYYVMTPARMEELIRTMFADIDYMGVKASEISKELQAMLINPFQYIVSAMWFPFQISVWSTVVNLPVGWWSMKGVNGYLFTAPYSSFSRSISIPKHPQTESRGKWVNQSPYTTYSLEFWPFGSISLDSAKLVDVSTLTIQVRVDHVSGVGTLRVIDENGSLVAASTAQIGVPLQLAQLSVDYGRLQGTTGVALTAAGAGALTVSEQLPQDKQITLGSMWQGIKRTAAAAFSGAVDLLSGNRSISDSLGHVTQTVTQQAAAIGNAANSILADLDVSGSNGGRAAYSFNIYLHMHWSSLADADITHDGRPLCQLRKINTLSGFILCKSGDIAISTASQGELDLIRAFLEGGFYYE